MVNFMFPFKKKKGEENIMKLLEVIDVLITWIVVMVTRMHMYVQTN